MIYFSKIRWKNLLSTGDVWTEINLSKNKLTMINGENGAGKTTLLDALTFSLYGKPYRKIKKPQLVNSINKKNLVVEIDFSIGNYAYKVIRGIKPNTFEIYRDGKLVDQDASSRDYQEFLERQILNLNYKSFCQIVILGSTSFVPFMQLQTADRRAIIEDLLDLEIFTVMNTILKERVSANNRELSDCDSEQSIQAQKLAVHEEYMQRIEKDNDKAIVDLDKRIAEARKQIATEERIINENAKEQNKLLSNKKDIKPIQDKLDKLRLFKSKIEDKNNTLQKDINFYSKYDNCPTCRQSIDSNFKENVKETNQSTIENNNNALTKISDDIKSSYEILNKLNEINKAYTDLETDNSIRKSTVRNLENNIRQFENDKSKLNVNKANAEDYAKLKEIGDKLTKLNSMKAELLEKKDVYATSSLILKDNGVKAAIIKQYVPVINKLINKYLSVMDFYAQFELDETFNETIKSRYRDTFSYDSFSEGEKTRINLAILFTWRAISKMRNSAASNLLIFDEVLDSSTDQGGIETFFNIIKSLASDNNVFIISHTQENYESKFNSIIRFAKVKNFSRIVN